VKSSDDLVQMVMTTKPGTTVPVQVMRDRREKTLSVTVDELDLDAESTQTRDNSDRREPDAGQETSGFGMTLGNITPDVARRLRLDDGTKGALILDVDPQSPAARAGLGGGDVIVRVGQVGVTSAAEAQRELTKVGSGKTAFLRVVRNGQERFVTIIKE
jgi:serine protease Do